jgi:biopolymer transport protein ExbB
MSEILARGGLFLPPLLLLAFVIWWLLFRRARFLRAATTERPGLAAEVARAWRRGEADACRRLAREERGLAAAVLARLFDGTGRPTRLRLEALVREAEDALEGAHRYLPTLVKIAPLLGLLGTVAGMVETFRVLEAMGAASPRAMSGGIGQALLTTQAGLLVALPGLFGGAWLEKGERRLHDDLERIRLLVGPALERDPVAGAQR